MITTKKIERSYWKEPLILIGRDAVTYEKIRQDEINEQKEIDASHWVYGNPYSASCDVFTWFIWFVRLGSIFTLMFYTSEAGYEIGWVIALIILFVLSCGSLFYCGQLQTHAREDNTGYVRTNAGQALMKKIDDHDQQQLKVYENKVRRKLGLEETENTLYPKRVNTASASRYPRQNFKLLKY